MQETNNYITVEEYLTSEEISSRRHEYVDGRIFVMTGVTRRHNVIVGNIYSMLRAHVRGSHCRAYMSGLKVRVERANSFYYPDVMVACDSDRCGDSSVFTASPVLIVEVLSRSTTSIDRREKVIAYRQIESLREYLIVHQKRRRVELHRKNAEGIWEVEVFGPRAELLLESVPVGKVRLFINAIYEDTDLSDPELEVREETDEDWTDEADSEADQEDPEADLDW